MKKRKILIILLIIIFFLALSVLINRVIAYYHKPTSPKFVIKKVEPKQSETGGYLETTICNEGAEANDLVVYIWYKIDDNIFYTPIYRYNLGGNLNSEYSIIHQGECIAVKTLSFNLYVEPKFIVKEGNNLVAVKVKNYSGNDWRSGNIPDGSQVFNEDVSSLLSKGKIDKSIYVETLNLKTSSANTAFSEENEGDYAVLGQRQFDFPALERDIDLERVIKKSYCDPIYEKFMTNPKNILFTYCDYITYGLDGNSMALGYGERAAAVNNYLLSIKDIEQKPSSILEFGDVNRIANGREPLLHSDQTKKVKETFQIVCGREPMSGNSEDEYFLKILAYGLRQRAQDRSLEKERAVLPVFYSIFNHFPESTYDWNILQALTYVPGCREK